MSSDNTVTSSIRHRDVELIERLSDVIDTCNSSSSSEERISLNELIDPSFNDSDYSDLRPAQVLSTVVDNKETQFRHITGVALPHTK